MSQDQHEPFVPPGGFYRPDQGRDAAGVVGGGPSSDVPVEQVYGQVLPARTGSYVPYPAHPGYGLPGGLSGGPGQPPRRWLGLEVAWPSQERRHAYLNIFGRFLLVVGLAPLGLGLLFLTAARAENRGFALNFSVPGLVLIVLGAAMVARSKKQTLGAVVIPFGVMGIFIGAVALILSAWLWLAPVADDYSLGRRFGPEGPAFVGSLFLVAGIALAAGSVEMMRRSGRQWVPVAGVAMIPVGVLGAIVGVLAWFPTWFHPGATDDAAKEAHAVRLLAVLVLWGLVFVVVGSRMLARSRRAQEPSAPPDGYGPAPRYGRPGADGPPELGHSGQF